MTEQPIEARCDGCTQLRLLFLYKPDCNPDDDHAEFGCDWCQVRRQPLLCVRCWSNQKTDEQRPPEPISWRYIDMRNRHKEALLERARAKQREADKATCEAIASATERAEADR